MGKQIFSYSILASILLLCNSPLIPSFFVPQEISECFVDCIHKGTFSNRAYDDKCVQRFTFHMINIVSAELSTFTNENNWDLSLKKHNAVIAHCENFDLFHKTSFRCARRNAEKSIINYMSKLPNSTISVSMEEYPRTHDALGG